MAEVEEQPPRPLRVLIGVPCGDMIHAYTALCLANLLAASRAYGVEAELMVAPGSMPVNNRSSLAAHAQENGFDALLLVDADMVFPPVALIGLLAHGDLDVVGATYSQRDPTGIIHGFELDGARLDVSAGGTLRAVTSLPCGMLLIRRRVLDTILACGDKPFFRFPWDQGANHSRSEDYDFCRRAREAGFAVHVDPELSLALGHIGTSIYRIPRAAGIALEDSNDCSETKVS